MENATDATDDRVGGKLSTKGREREEEHRYLHRNQYVDARPSALHLTFFDRTTSTMVSFAAAPATACYFLIIIR
eukprot:scaffold11920_cov70-Skeletonema_dohrnii-CCMP3373.AAC.2